jgi:hypothetical protein
MRRPSGLLLCLLLSSCAPVPSAREVDDDGDGFGSIASGGVDCDDGDAAVNPDAVETCNGVDDDCDFIADDALLVTFWLDDDGDGFGGPASTAACALPEGYAAEGGDCDDRDATVSPGAEEVCDGIDQDCDDVADEDVKGTYLSDRDGDGFGDDAATIEACDAPEGYVVEGGDCNDGDETIHPDAAEICDERDQDCDGTADDGVSAGSVYYGDLDGDGFGDAGLTVEACGIPAGFVAVDGDCDDGDALVNPSASETCNDVDDDCDGEIDDLLDDGRDGSSTCG